MCCARSNPTKAAMKEARAKGLARNTAAEGALLDAICVSNTKGCTEIVMGSRAVDFLINYFRRHDLIESKGLDYSRVPIVERRRNLFEVLFRLTQELL
eukprot:COSAG02_NODE_10200_length_1996_cov_3.594623_2_plen_98_part_00